MTHAASLPTPTNTTESQPDTFAIRKPYLIFVGDTETKPEVKTAIGVRDWARDDCVAQWRLTPAAYNLGLPDLSPRDAYACGARSLLIGVAPVGGDLPKAWVDSLLQALEAGLDVVSGLHSRLSEIDVLAKAAARLGRRMHDVRHSDRPFPIATGKKRSGKRLLTVGTDCALGKKYTALALADALRVRGISADFRATGQTGVMIAGSGVAIDAVVSDFIAGAAEALSPAAASDHWDVIEGQGALFHPAYAGVALGLLHGSQPDAMVLCHDPARATVNGYPDYPLPSIDEAMAANLAFARRTNPNAQFVAISLNTSAMTEIVARGHAREMERRFDLPVFDPMRFGIDAAVDRVLA